MNTPQYEIRLLNVQEYAKVLRFIAPELKKELDKEMKSLMRPILVEAQSLYPATERIHPSGWRKGGWKKFNAIGPLTQEQTRGFPSYSQDRARSGLRILTPKSNKKAGGFTGFYGIVQRDPGGAIYETAGRGSAGSRARTAASRSKNPYASRQFIQTVQAYHGVLPTARHQGNDKGRALIRAFDNNRSKLLGQVQDALKTTMTRLQKRLDSEKEV
jgi:hypothetical protein